MALELSGGRLWDFLFPRHEPQRSPDIQAEASKGAHASALLESDTYKDAFRKVREGIHIRWAGSPVADKDGQHELRIMLKLLDDLEANIKEIAVTGKLAAIQLDQQVNQVKR